MTTDGKTPITYQHGRNLYINITNQCTNRCDFCVRNNSDGSIYSENLWYRGPEPSKETILADINRRDLNRYNEIVFCGYGEPACRWDDMMWLCDAIKKHGSHFVRINTNGQADLIHARPTAIELDGRVDAISVSLNASNAYDYDDICHSQFALEAFPAMVRFTASAVFYVPHVTMTAVGAMSKEELEACRRICDKIGAEFRVREYIKQ